jgi:tetratricopeptide (TPR) repeat protein
VRDPERKKDAEVVLQITEHALLTIAKPLLKKKYQEVADAAHEVAPLLGSIGAQFLLDMVSQLPEEELDEIRHSLVWSAAWAYHDAGDMRSAQKRFILARKLAASKGLGSLSARMAIDLGVIAYNCEDLENARYWYETARNEAKKAKDEIVEAIAIHNLAVRKMERDPIVARKLLERSLKMKETAGASKDSLAGNWTNLGILYAQAGKHEQAYSLFKKSLETYRSFRDYSNLALASLNLANASSELGRFKEADGLYRKGILISRKYADIHSEILLHQGYATNAFKYERFSIAAREFRALHDAQTTIGNKRDAAVALHDLALSTARAGDPKKGKQIAKQTAMLFKAYGDWDWYKRCLLLIATEMESSASDVRLAVLREAADLKRGRNVELKLRILQTLWHDLIERGLYKEASQHLSREKALLRRDKPQLKERLHHAGMKLLDRGRKKEALRLLRQVEKLTKRGDKLGIAKVRQDLAIVLAGNGKNTEAIFLLERNIIFAKRRRDRILLSVNIGNLGEIKSRAGLSEESIPLLRKAAKLSGDLHDTQGEVMWLNNLALALSDIEQHDESINILKSALKQAQTENIQTEAARILGSLGNISAKNCQFKEASRYYTTAINIAKKIGMKEFAVSMRYNRAFVYFYDHKKDAAFKDAVIVVQEAFSLLLFDLARQASYSTAKWAIDWHRPATAGEFTAVNFLSCLGTEEVHFNNFYALLLLAYLKFMPKRYHQYRNALKRQLQQSEKSGKAWEKIEQMEKCVHTIDTKDLQLKLKLAEKAHKSYDHLSRFPARKA